jgi:hypothetical protein
MTTKQKEQKELLSLAKKLIKATGLRKENEQRFHENCWEMSRKKKATYDDPSTPYGAARCKSAALWADEKHRRWLKKQEIKGKTKIAEEKYHAAREIAEREVRKNRERGAKYAEVLRLRHLRNEVAKGWNRDAETQKTYADADAAAAKAFFEFQEFSNNLEHEAATRHNLKELREAMEAARKEAYDQAVKNSGSFLENDEIKKAEEEEKTAEKALDAALELEVDMDKLRLEVEASKKAEERAVAALKDATAHKRGNLMERARSIIDRAEKDAETRKLSKELKLSIAATKKVQREEEAKAEAEEKIARAARWQARLEKLGISTGTAPKVVEAIEEAVADGLDLAVEDIEEIVDALEYAHRNKSSAWCAYRSGDMFAKQLVRCCVGAHRRHENTNYDGLLAAGMDRDSARACAESVI